MKKRMGAAYIACRRTKQNEQWLNGSKTKNYRDKEHLAFLSFVL